MIRRLLLVSLVLALPVTLLPVAQEPSRVVAFVGVTVVPMDRERVLENHTVLVRDGTIRGGTIEAGQRADLVLLAADPLADISNTRRIDGVMVAGRWLPKAEIDRRLAALVVRP